MEITPLSQLISLKGKVAIVTGGAVGIGYGIAYRLAEAGASIVVADLKLDLATEAVKKLTEAGFKAVPCEADISKEEAVSKMVQTTVDAFGGVDILVNNAGIYPFKLLMDLTPADFDRIIGVNLRGAYLCTKQVAQTMIKQGRGGRIINITSIDALHPSMVGLAAYDASKHGLWGFTKNVALELAQHKIWVNAIAPGGIATPGSSGGTTADTTKAFEQKIPMHRMGVPDDIGRAVLFLASDLASYMTGEQIVVDGGFLLA